MPVFAVQSMTSETHQDTPPTWMLPLKMNSYTYLTPLSELNNATNTPFCVDLNDIWTVCTCSNSICLSGEDFLLRHIEWPLKNTAMYELNHVHSMKV